MNTLEAIEARKKWLLERSNDERNEIARIYYRWQARGEMTRKVGRFLKNPLVLSGLGLLALKMPWRRTFKFSGWFWKGWKIFRLLRRII